jgi:hypothetical protein
MNPNRRTNYPLFFTELRAWIDSIVPPSKPSARCADCGGVIYLIHGKHSGKWFYSHQGWAGCEAARAIMFNTREEAEQSTEVFP